MKPTKILQIGINYFGTSCELRGCINDVHNLNAFFRSEFDCSGTQFRLLLDDSKDKVFMPTKFNILAGLRWLIEGATADSCLFLHYSGHGSYTKDASGDEADGRDECICPCDDTRIIDDELRKVLIDALPKGCRLFALFDCCHSGSVLDLKYTYGISENLIGKQWTINSDNKYVDSKANVILITGCTDDQTSADAYEAGSFQGAMTYALLETVKSLKESGKPLKYKDVMKNMLRFLKKKRYTQKPQISSGTFLNLEDSMW